MDERVNWSKGLQEYQVEHFYGDSVEKFGDFHGGYLNFGLWEQGNNDYIKAAENLILTLGRMLGLNKRSKLLDVACGMGAQDVFLQKSFRSNITALDVTWNHVKIAKERIEKNNMTKDIQIFHGTAINLPFKDNSFTNVLSIEGPEHFDTREKFFLEAYRVLKPKGVICLSDYIIKRQPKSLWEKFVIKAARKLWHVPKANVYDVTVYKEKLVQAGFKNIIIKEVGKSVIPGYYYEQRRKVVRKDLRKIRGLILTELSFFIDYFVLKSFKKGLIEYILVKAEK